MKLNKTNLNKVIKWTSSKFNEWSKSKIIDQILTMKVGEILTASCGSYSEKSWCGGYNYKIVKTINKLIIDCNGKIKVLGEKKDEEN